MNDRSRESDRDDWSLGTILLCLAVLAVIAGGAYVYRQRMVRQQLMVMRELAVAQQFREEAARAQVAAITHGADAEALQQRNGELEAENERLSRELEEMKKSTATTPDPAASPPG